MENKIKEILTGAIENKANRDTKIDFYRGIAVLGVISIHTSFKSGQFYVPEWFRSLTLLIDVSFFFFISGKSLSFYEADLFKTVKSLFKTWIKWVYSITILAAFCYLFNCEGVENIRDLVQNYLFNVSFPSLKVIIESVWFMPYYFVIIFVNQIILSAMSLNKEKYQEYKKLYLFILAALFIWVIAEHDFFGINQYYLFYSFFLILGLLSSQVKQKILKKPIFSIIFIIIGYFISCYLTDMPYIRLQLSKFPPNLPYMFASMLFIIITMIIDKYIKHPNEFITHIGKNAIFYFLAQGISSTWLFSIAPDLFFLGNWFVRFVIAFLINVLLAVIIAEFFAVTYNLLLKVKKFYMTSTPPPPPKNTTDF